MPNNKLLELNESYTINNNTVNINPVLYETGSRKYQIASIFGIPFYKSSGNSSGYPETWFPFLGIRENYSFFFPRGHFNKPAFSDNDILSKFKALSDKIPSKNKEREFSARIYNNICLSISACIGGGIWSTAVGKRLKEALEVQYPELFTQLKNWNINEPTKEIKDISALNQWLCQHGQVKGYKKGEECRELLESTILKTFHDLFMLILKRNHVNLLKIDIEHKDNKQVNEIANTIGLFSANTTPNGNKIHVKEGPAFLFKQAMEPCQPEDNWLTQRFTKLKHSLCDQKADKTITISSKTNSINAEESFGKGSLKISIGEIYKCVSSTIITTQQNLIPKDFYHEIQTNIFDRLNQNDTRTLKEILTKKEYETWKEEFTKLGFNSKEDFIKAANTSLKILASGVCISGKVHFFVEQRIVKKNGKNYVYNQIRNQNLDNSPTTTLLTVPGLDFAFSGKVSEQLKKDDKLAADIILKMWDAVLAAAQTHGVKHLVIPPIGLGQFAGSKQQSQKIARVYFDGLMKLLTTKYKYMLSSVYYSSGCTFAHEGYNAEFNDTYQKYAENLGGTEVHHFKGDVKFLAVELTKNGFETGLVNPGDANGIWGLNDLGELFKTAECYAVDEDLSATSTWPFASRYISNVYDNPYKTYQTVLNKNNIELKSIDDSNEFSASDEVMEIKSKIPFGKQEEDDEVVEINPKKKQKVYQPAFKSKQDKFKIASNCNDELIKLYKVDIKNNTKLAIEFETEDRALDFMEYIHKYEVFSSDDPFNPDLICPEYDYDDKSNIVYFPAFVSKNNELAVVFPSTDMRTKVINALHLDKIENSFKGKKIGSTYKDQAPLYLNNREIVTEDSKVQIKLADTDLVRERTVKRMKNLKYA